MTHIADAPKVGDLGTIHHPQDRMPVKVVAVSKSGTKVMVANLATDHLRPTDMHNGLPVYDHMLTGNEAQGAVRPAYWTPTMGRYQMFGCTPVFFGSARYYRDYSDD